MELSDITVTLTPADWELGSAYDEACDQIARDNVRTELKKTYRNAKVAIDTDSVQQTEIALGFINDEDESMEARDLYEDELTDDIKHLIEKIEDRVACGDLAPDPEDYEEDADDENEAA